MMISLATRALHKLREPLPQLCAYLVGKVTSLVWRSHIGGVGRGFFVGGGARILGGRAVTIGDRFYAGPFLWIEAIDHFAGHRYAPSIIIGSHVTCSDFVHIAATTSVTIGDGVLIGSRVHITDHGHGAYGGSEQDSPSTPPALRRLTEGRPVVIGKNVWLGDGVVILPGVTIGDGSVVGANSVVTRSLAGGVIAVGAPAVAVKHFDAGCGKWLPAA